MNIKKAIRAEFAAIDVPDAPLTGKVFPQPEAGPSGGDADTASPDGPEPRFYRTRRLRLAVSVVGIALFSIAGAAALALRFGIPEFGPGGPGRPAPPPAESETPLETEDPGGADDPRDDAEYLCVDLASVHISEVLGIAFLDIGTASEALKEKILLAREEYANRLIWYEKICLADGNECILHADPPDLDYTWYEGADIAGAPYSWIAEVAALDAVTAPESLRETILWAREAFREGMGWEDVLISGGVGDAPDTDYEQYLGAEIETAPLELVDEIACLSIGLAPEALRETIRQARERLLNEVILSAMPDMQAIQILGGSVDGKALFIVAPLSEGKRVEFEFLKTSRIFPPWERYEKEEYIMDYSHLTPKKYEDALRELKSLLEQIYGPMEVRAADAADYARYAGVEMETAPEALIGAIAFLDLEAAPEGLQEKIRQARNVIIHSTEWTLGDPSHSFQREHDEPHRQYFIPRFNDLFPGWDSPKYTLQDFDTWQLLEVRGANYSLYGGPLYHVFYHEGDGIPRKTLEIR